MKPETQKQLKEMSLLLLAWLREAFDKTADWVTQKSWKWLALFGFVTLIIAGILQDTLFVDGGEDRITYETKQANPRIVAPGIDISLSELESKKARAAKAEKEANEAAEAAEAAAEAAEAAEAAKAEPPEPPEPVPPINAVAPTTPAPANGTAPPPPPPAAAAALTSAQQAEMRNLLRQMQRTERIAKRAAEQAKKASQQAKQAAIEASDAAALANTSSHERVIHYKKQSSRWFMNFVVLSLIGLFVTKVMMGGKKRAEAQTEAARANAEREAMQRQVSEAKMQMMQAQVEPHFLFNTLASVEYLIETDPPRAAAMQRSLIKYLRAVLPQMRENALIINLGRELDLVTAYLELLKMRMEERLQVQFEVDEHLRNAAFPPMMLQMLVENAIKHGLECKEEGGTLRISASLPEDGVLRVCVCDDGVGFGAVKSDSTGLGLPSIRERLKLLHGADARLMIEPNQPTGVCATIEVPYAIASAEGKQ